MCLGRKFSGTENSAWQVWRNGRCLRAKQCVATLQIQHGENVAVFGRGTSLSLSLSLVARTFWHAFGLSLKGFFTHFIVVFSYFIVVFSHLFTCKRHFLGYFVFLKFLNALFLGFLRLSLRAVCLKTADFVILSVAKNPKNLRYALFMDTSLALSMTNLVFCLKITDIFTHILKQKFKFFTQNSKHFTNSTHFITLSQISSPTQGFFIFLPQIFEQFLLINLVERRSYGSSWHKRQDKNSRAD